MKDEIEFPETLQEAIKYFADDQRAFDYMKAVRWPTGKVSCPRCKSEKNSFVSTRKIWHCSDCKRQFSIKVGTIFEDSAIKYDKWICATWLIANAKNGISSYELGRSIGVCQKTAWFMLQRIRLAMQNGTVVKLGGTVEVDESYIGGKARNMHFKRRKALGTSAGFAPNVTPVQGLLERHGKGKSRIVLKHLRTTKAVEVQGNVREYVLKGSHVYSDTFPGYKTLAANSEFVHKVVNHAERYVDGVVHTNGLENFWALLKRTIRGTYVSVEPFHLFRYLDEQSFRFNEREDTDSGRFIKVMAGIIGKSLTFAKLTGKDAGDGRLELVPV